MIFYDITKSTYDMQAADIVWHPMPIIGCFRVASRPRALQRRFGDSAPDMEGECVATVEETIAKMRAVAPPGQPDIDAATRAELSRLTRQLIAAADSGTDLRRFDAVRKRSIGLPDDTRWLAGRRVVVTGGTGCVGSALIRLLGQLGPASVASISRGRTAGWPRYRHADYQTADVTDPGQLAAAFAAAKPDVVFHLAAQRDPGLAETLIIQTVATNLLGTRNVIAAAAGTGVTDLVFASSGKALRPYSGEVYTATKRAAEWLLARAADGTDRRYSAARFTHVVDNSIIAQRLRGWCQGRAVVRLHDPGVMFYVQSARESAELLLRAGVTSRRGTMQVSALTDLGMPIGLLELAVGMLEQAGSAAPIYWSGFEAGYERAPFPGLYDPRTAPDVSPLINGFEAAEVLPGPPVDVCPVRYQPCCQSDELLDRLATSCATDEPPAVIRAGLDQLSWSLFDGAMSVACRGTLARAAQLTERHGCSLSAEHSKMLAVVRKYANAELAWTEARS
jgi:nucleoside-diphosphate-sugar epimerase